MVEQGFEVIYSLCCCLRKVRGECGNGLALCLLLDFLHEALNLCLFQRAIDRIKVTAQPPSNLTLLHALCRKASNLEITGR
jgi:hypothetical protein